MTMRLLTLAAGVLLVTPAVAFWNGYPLRGGIDALSPPPPRWGDTWPRVMEGRSTDPMVPIYAPPNIHPPVERRPAKQPRRHLDPELLKDKAVVTELRRMNRR